MKTALLILLNLLQIPSLAFGFGIGAPLAAAGTATFLGWAFKPVGPDEEAAASVSANPPVRVPELNGLLFGDSSVECAPTVAIYCGAKVRPASYALLARQILAEITKRESSKQAGGVLVLQSPFNIYAFKPASVEKVLAAYPTIKCIAGHSIGGIWAMEYCQKLAESSDSSFPNNALSFVYLGVHSSVLSLAQFRDVPFRSVGYTYATNDVTLRNAATKNDETIERHIARIQTDELPSTAKIYSIDGGNHSQYGSYGMPSYKQGLAYKDLEADLPGAEQRDLVAKAIVDTMMQ